MDLRRKQIYLTPELNEHLSKVALATGRSESRIVREALSEYVAKLEREADERENPLAKLLALRVDSSATDGSLEHDRDLYAPTESPGDCGK